MTLAVVTAVLLGGVDIFGGAGRLLGVVLAIFTLAVLQNALRLADVSSQLQSISIGLLLTVSVVVPKLAQRLVVEVTRDVARQIANDEAYDLVFEPALTPIYGGVDAFIHLGHR